MVKTILTMLCLLLWNLTPSLGQTWELVKQKDGISVFQRKTDDSPIKELKVVTTIKSSMDYLLDFIGNVDDFPNWIYRCKEARIIDQPTDSSPVVYYSRLDFPWPTRDRDFYAKTFYHRNDSTDDVQIDVVLDQKDHPLVDHVIRLPILRVKWILTQQSPSEIIIEYFLHTDPGGGLPAWIVNLALTKGPIETMQALRRHIN